MRKRISLLIAALMLALTMSFGGAGAAFAAPSCTQAPNNPNCVKEGPGNSENTSAFGKNPRTGFDFQPGTPGGR